MDPADRIGLATVHSLGKGVAREADEKQALKAFEAYFLGELLKQAAPQGGTGLFDGGQAGRMYRDHFYQELARVIAENGGLGLARELEGQLGTAETDAAEPSGGDGEEKDR